MGAKSFEEFEKALRACMKDERTKSGATQADLARRNANLKASTIAKFEAGQIPNVTLRSVYELAKASSQPLSELIKRAEGSVNAAVTEPWKKLVQNVEKLPESKKEWLARLLQEALRGSVG